MTNSLDKYYDKIVSHHIFRARVLIDLIEERTRPADKLIISTLGIACNALFSAVNASNLFPEDWKERLNPTLDDVATSTALEN